MFGLKEQCRAEEGRAYRVPKRAFRICAVALEPIPAVPGIHPGSIAMTILTFTSLHAGQQEKRETASTCEYV